MTETLSLSGTAVILAIVILAYVVRGITGFGSGLIAIPLLALFLPLTWVVPVVLVLDFSASALISARSFRLAPMAELWPVIITGSLGIGTALLVVQHIDTDLLSRFLGAFILLYAAYSLSHFRPQKQGTQWWALPSGYLGGLVGGVFGTGGPFYVFYFQLRQLDKTQFRAAFSLVFLIDGLIRLGGFASLGLYDENALKMLLYAFPAMLLALWAGSHIHTSLSQQVFERGIAALLVLSGLALLLR